ncbi:hypothetical protein ACFSQ3_13155 [Sphingobacterium corticis]|uniref:Phage protein n=1 Tax=Sphingobacterium corticis TaxID=1812823 RepID=A0ABW5NM26_9SPHI
MKKQHTRFFDLKEVGFNDLDGNFTAVNFDQKDFGNALFKNAQSIEMDSFAKEIHTNGNGELNDIVEAELAQLVQGLYHHRVAQAVIETIKKIK